MKAHTVCLRCHQKCHLVAEVVNGKIEVVVDAAPYNRTPACREVCPIGMDVPGYLIAVSQGRFEEAMQIIRETNPFPMVCGRICHHPCEEACVRGAVDEPVAIMSVKRFIADRAGLLETMPTPVPRSQKETVAIIGSGPAGLTAAHDLVMNGFGVTVYEASSEPGGMLTRVIPEFKLPKAAVEADLNYLRALGVDVRTNTPIGGELTIERLRKDYHAVLIAVGSWKTGVLSVPGSDLQSVYYALPLLEELKKGKEVPMNGRVLVIGGGNTAMDAARAAVRLGATEVHIACLESLKAMPADAWEVDSAVREGIHIHPSLAPKKFRDDGDGRVAGVDFRGVGECHMEGGSITWTLKSGSDSDFSLDAEVVIIAVGQSPSISDLISSVPLNLTPRGTLEVDSGTMACGIPGIFAAGDVVAGAGTVVESMAAGRKAAASVIQYLTGSKPRSKEPSLTETLQRAKKTVDVAFPEERMRHILPTIPTEEAVSSFTEVNLGYREQAARKEAARCLNCATVCIKGATIPDLMYHPDRLLYPLKRMGARGEGKWQRISWDEALDTIAGKLKEIKEKYGPEAVHISCGSGQKHIGIQAAQIAERMWPAPNVHFGRYTCILPDVMANAATFGDSVTYEFGPDYGDAKCIVFWGSEADVATPAQARVIHRALRSGSKLIVVDPRPIPMAKRADVWLRIRPGTDMALALAMANVIINEGLYDREFVEKYCDGFELLKDHVQKYTPEWAAQITGLSEENIIKAAQLYAVHKPGCIYVRLGSGAQQITSSQTCRAISILIGITGSVDARGGNLLYHRTFQEALMWHPYIMFVGVKPPAAVNEKRFGAAEYPMMDKQSMCHIPSTIRAMEEGSVKVLWALADNLIVAEMDSRRIWDIMKTKLDFIFVSELFMTPTAALADIILPAAFYPEIDQLVEAFGHPSSTVKATLRVVEPAGECRDDREVAIEIGRRMGMDVSPWDTVRDFFDWMLQYQTMTYEELLSKPNATLTLPRKYERYKTSNPPFNTPTGKVELYSKVFEARGVDPLPVYEEPPESPVRTPDLFKKFPFIYTHYRIHGFMHSEGRQIKRQRGLNPEPCLQMNPERAAELDIGPGDWVYLETPGSKGKGRVKFRAELIPDMHPDVVAGPHAWWFPEKRGPEYGCFESNINAIVSLDPPYDPMVGVPQVRAILCRVWKANTKYEENMPINALKKSVEDLLRVPAPELKDHLPRALEEIRKYGIGNLLGDYPGFMGHLLKQLKQAGPAQLLSEIPHAAAPLADTLWEGVAFLAGRSKTMQSILKEVERDFCCNIEASDSPFQSHFATERGNIHGGAGLVHFKNEDFRIMGPTELLMDLLTGDLFMGFGNLRLQTAGHPGWTKRIAPVMGEIGRLLKGA